ncbi:TolC family protein [Dyadobacter sp. MSC1_007]|jgi:cobalt-zinc-cadmium efflux system outer membrane protein|uniref:TolC family protein n=1 Tax=Dyadobacter sp. MSC1_007 TaxID=2909264 RepID=UPI00202E8576|nr:TolC family protein [Dyadobacter sp. MSC1_007]
MCYKIATAILIVITMRMAPVKAQKAYTLQEALQAAKSNNPVLKTRQFDIGISQSDITTAQLRPNPILNNQSLQLVQPSRFPEHSSWYNGTNRQVWWQLTKPFQLPVQRRNKINFAEQNVRLTEKQYADTERHLFQSVAQKWLDVWSARKQLDLLTTARNNIDSLATINRLRLKNQVITSTDLSRTELLANQYEIQLKSARQDYLNEISNLKFLMGVQDSVAIDTADQFAFAFPDQMDAIVQQALQNRSDIQTIKLTMDVADANIKLQKSTALPTPELGLIYNPQNKAQYMGVYGTIEIPIFSRNQGEIRKSQVIKQQAEQDLLATGTQLETEIRTAYKTYTTQKQNVQNFNQLLTQSQTILNSVKYSYLRGGTTIIDFLEAQRSWLDTQQQYYDVLGQYRQSYIDLLYASGLINQIAQ